MQDFKTSVSQNSAGQKLMFSNYQKLNSSLRQTISQLENEKVKLHFYYDIFIAVSALSSWSDICAADSSGQPAS